MLFLRVRFSFSKRIRSLARTTSSGSLFHIFTILGVNGYFFTSLAGLDFSIFSVTKLDVCNYVVYILSI